MIFDGIKSANLKMNALAEEIAKFSEKLTLNVIQIGDNQSSNLFINNKKKFAEKLGINLILCKFPESIREKEILKKIEELNFDNDVHGIMIQLPIPQKFNKTKLLNKIFHYKDVDGLGAFNKGLLEMHEEFLVPPTARAVLSILEDNEIDLNGKRVLVVGDGEVAGRPISKLLLNRAATVTICNDKTKDLTFFTKNAEIIITAVGKANLINKAMVQANLILIDVGIEIANNVISGDLNFEELKDQAAIITPTPGGVGPLTIFYLLNNLVKCYKYINKF